MFGRTKEKPLAEGVLSVAVSGCTVIVDQFSESDDAVQLCGFLTAYVEAVGRAEYRFKGCDENFLGSLWSIISQDHPTLAGKFSLFVLSFVDSAELMQKSHPALALRDHLSNPRWNWAHGSNDLQEWMATLLTVVQKLMADNLSRSKVDGRP